MSLSIPNAPNAGLFKQGYNSYDAEDGAVLRNIDACRTIASTVQTSLGPYGRNKIVINHLQKMILTNDAATILRELDVVHPAAKLIVMASQQQEAEMGDATNMVIVLAGELLKKAEELLRMGLKTSEIVQGYERAQKIALEALEELEVDSVGDIWDQKELAKALRTVIAAKQNGNEQILAEMVAEAVLAVMPKNPFNFNVDNIRVVKIMGGSLEQSKVVRGMVFGREPDGTVKKAVKAKVGVFSCPIDISQTETKGTVLLKSSKELFEFTKGEEHQMENTIKELHDSGMRVVVAGGPVGELALHYLNRAGILVIKIMSKFELRRLCRVVGATPLARLGAPMPDEMGSVDVVETLEIGGDRVTVFRQENDQTRTATLVLRGATQNHLDDIERAVDDGVNVVKAITRDSRLVPGAGASEMELIERISRVADKTAGLAQYSIRKYAEAFEVIPRTLAESAGLDATEVLARLYTAHQTTPPTTSSSAAGAAGKANGTNGAAKAQTNGDAEDEDDDEEEIDCTGVDMENSDGSGTLDASEEGILDLMLTKQWAIRLATEAARTVLSVDQIIVARQAGGPKPPGPNPNWDED
ncbi:T-complex protein 1 subunit theta [Elasticomyces elasticus]|nr:T-complex protein 1 subunit theta [Elasticomyces elasticus]